jgi:hypothetical protein
MIAARLHTMGFPYQMCAGEVDKHLVSYFDDWLRNKAKERVVFISDPYTERTERAMRTLGTLLLMKDIPGRYISTLPFDIAENTVYIFPYTNNSYIRIFPQIVVRGAYGWVFNYEDIDIVDLHSRNSLCVERALPDEAHIDFEEV